MKKRLLNFAFKFVVDIFFGLLSALFAHLLIGYLLPDIINGLHAELGNEGLSITLFSIKVNPEIFQKWFSFLNCFGLLFGVRIIVAYLTGNYKWLDEEDSSKLEIEVKK